MNSPTADGHGIEVGALAINIVVPEDLRWTDERRGQTFRLESITLRMLPDGALAAKAYGRPTSGGRGAYVSFPLPDRPELRDLVHRGAAQAAVRWSEHRGLT